MIAESGIISFVSLMVLFGLIIVRGFIRCTRFPLRSYIVTEEYRKISQIRFETLETDKFTCWCICCELLETFFIDFSELSVAFLQLSLFVADLLQSIGGAMDIKWVHTGIVQIGHYCTAEGDSSILIYRGCYWKLSLDRTYSATWRDCCRFCHRSEWSACIK